MNFIERIRAYFRKSTPPTLVGIPLAMACQPGRRVTVHKVMRAEFRNRISLIPYHEQDPGEPMAFRHGTDYGDSIITLHICCPDRPPGFNAGVLDLHFFLLGNWIGDAIPCEVASCEHVGDDLWRLQLVRLPAGWNPETRTET